MLYKGRNEETNDTESHKLTLPNRITSIMGNKYVQKAHAIYIYTTIRKQWINPKQSDIGRPYITNSVDQTTFHGHGPDYNWHYSSK